MAFEVKKEKEKKSRWWGDSHGKLLQVTISKNPNMENMASRPLSSLPLTCNFCYQGSFYIFWLVLNLFTLRSNWLHNLAQNEWHSTEASYDDKYVNSGQKLGIWVAFRRREGRIPLILEDKESWPLPPNVKSLLRRKGGVFHGRLFIFSVFFLFFSFFKKTQMWHFILQISLSSFSVWF